MASFTKKLLELHLTLSVGSFGGRGNTKIIKSLAMAVNVKKDGLPSKNSAQATVWGMKPEDMEALTTLAFDPMATEHHKISILAGDEEHGMTQAFAGEVHSAFADFNAGPDIAFKFDCKSGVFPALTPARPQTFQGATGVADIISGLAGEIGYSFKNNGVDVQLSNPVLNGSPMDKMQSAAKAAGIDLLVDDNQVIISPAGQGNGRKEAVLLNKDTGMIGYPSFNNQGITVKSLYNPAFAQGGLIKVESEVPKATGVWRTTKLAHALQNFDDVWDSALEATYA